LTEEDWYVPHLYPVQARQFSGHNLDWVLAVVPKSLPFTAYLNDDGHATVLEEGRTERVLLIGGWMMWNGVSITTCSDKAFRKIWKKQR
jgi:hypothetical protein